MVLLHCAMAASYRLSVVRISLRLSVSVDVFVVHLQHSVGASLWIWREWALSSGVEPSRVSAAQNADVADKDPDVLSSSVPRSRRTQLHVWSSAISTSCQRRWSVPLLLRISMSEVNKVKRLLCRKPISELRSVICHMGSHSVTCHLTQVNALHFNPSETDWYFICIPRTDGRLSWP